MEYTKEFIEEEYRKIEASPCYFYNTYWVDENGNKPKTISEQDWQYMIDSSTPKHYKGRSRYSI